MNEELKAELDRLADETAKLRQVINDAAQPWLALNPGIAWEGGLDAAMRAAVAEIERLRTAVLAEREACARVADADAECAAKLLAGAKKRFANRELLAMIGYQGDPDAECIAMEESRDTAANIAAAIRARKDET